MRKATPPVNENWIDLLTLFLISKVLFLWISDFALVRTDELTKNLYIPPRFLINFIFDLWWLKGVQM